MKKLLTVLFVLISLIAKAQPSPTSSQVRFPAVWVQFRDTATARLSDTACIFYFNNNFWVRRNSSTFFQNLFDGSGTVTSIATNNGTGITGGTITGSGTLVIDTTLISTRAWRQKGTDSTLGLIALKVNISDTSAMLVPYLRKSDTLFMLSPYLRKTDTSTMLSPYVRKGQLSDSIIWGNIRGSLNNQTDLRDTLAKRIYNQIGSNLSAQTAKFRIDDTAWARMFRGAKAYVDSVQATSSSGVGVYSNNGTQVGQFGAGGGAGTTLYGGLNGTTGAFSTSTSAPTVKFDSAYVDNTLLSYMTFGQNIRLSASKNIFQRTNSNANYFLMGRDPSNDSLYVGTVTGGTIIAGSKITFRTLPISGIGQNISMPNSSGIVALTSNVTDSSSALRASINTKLNISDTAAMLSNRLKISDTANMLSKYPLINGTRATGTWNISVTGNAGTVTNGVYTTTFNTLGDARYLQLTGGTLSGALSGTSGTFSSTVTGLFVSPSSNPASTGVLRLANNNPISWRNQANSADISLYLNSSNVLVSEASFNTAGTVTATGATLTGALSGTSGTFTAGVNMATTSGNVGIGTTSPDPYTSNIATLSLGGTNANFSGAINFQVNGVSKSNWVNRLDYLTADMVSGNGFKVRINGSDHFTIVSAGRSLFGTTTDDGSSIGQFNGNVKVQNDLIWSVTSGGYMKTVSGTQLFASSFTGSNYLYSGGTDFRVNNQADNATLLTILNSGAATFSSSVTSNGNGTFGSGVGGSTITDFTINGGSSGYPNIRLTTGGTLQSQIQSFGGVMYLQTNGSTTALTLASNQAATFSSSVTAKHYTNNTTSVSTTYSVANDIGVVFADATSGNFTITLPTASSCTGRVVYIKRTDCTLPNSITISGATDNGSLGARDGAIYISNGSTWYCIAIFDGSTSCA